MGLSLDACCEGRDARDLRCNENPGYAVYTVERQL
jgi:hypothetical protein